MKRIIKFRAWDGKKMLYDGIVLDMSDCSRHSTRLDFWGDSPTNIKIMQFIGLHDKNGKEIWEGDVVEILAEDKRVNRLVVKYGIATREMMSGWTVDIPSFYFDLLGANFKAYPIVKNWAGKHDLDMLEVIGNIYESPELLK